MSLSLSDKDYEKMKKVVYNFDNRYTEIYEDLENDRKESHKTAIKYLNDSLKTLNKEDFKQIDEIKKHLQRSLINLIDFSGSHVDKLVKHLNESADLKKIRLIYFLESFYNPSYPEPDLETEKSYRDENTFQKVIQYLAKTLDEFEFLKKMYPEHFNDYFYNMD